MKVGLQDRVKCVWVFNHYAQIPSRPGGTRHYSLCQHLADQGWNSVIFAASVELNTDHDRLPAGIGCGSEMHGAVRFMWLRVPRSNGSDLRRAAGMLIYTWRAICLRPGHVLPKPDVIIGSSVHPLAALAGLLQARRHRVPFVFEVRDLWPQTLIDLGKISPRGLPARMMQCLERYLYRKAHKIVVLLPFAADYICALGIPASRVAWVPNGVEPGPHPQPCVARSDGARAVFMYFGAHGRANGLTNVLRAMRIAQERASKFELRLIGDGPQKQELVQLARTLELTNVRFEDPVPKDRIRTLAGEADAFVFNLVGADVFRYGVSSNKLFDYLAAGRPVVFACSAGNDPVTTASAGIRVPPDDPKALHWAMDQIARMLPEDRAKMGESGRQWVVDNHSYHVLAEKLAGVLNELVHPTRTEA